MENHNRLEDQVKDWKELRELVFKIKDSTSRRQLRYFQQYMEKRNAYELKYHEKFNRLKMPY